MRVGDPKYCFLVSVALAGTACFLLLTKYEETLPASERKKLVLTDMQPFSFMQLFKSDVMKKLLLVSGIQSLTEGRSIYDVLSLFLQEDLKWPVTSINRFVGFNGLGLVVGGITAKPMIASLGARKFTSIANICNTMNFVLWSLAAGKLNSSAAMYLGAVIAFLGSRKRDCMEAKLMTIGVGEGFGKGFISGASNNFRSIVNIIGPLLFGQAYAWGRRIGVPSLPFLVAAISTLLAQVPLATISNKQLGLDENGREAKKEETAK